MENNKQLIWGGIVIGAVVLLIGSGVLFADKNSDQPINQVNLGLGGNNSQGGAINVRPVSEQDHILGSAKAPVKIIVYSDLECPFCKRFHFDLLKVAKDFGPEKVAIIYRHFPLDNLHSKARAEAMATECAAEMGGSEKFWQYLDKVYAETPSNNGLDLALLPQFASQIGLDAKTFKACLASNKYADKIEQAVQEAISAGAQGTPYPVIIDTKGKVTALKGALPYENLKQVVSEALK
ncbi:MAG: hypothetical protein UV64_C0003G0022 [Parcubacteria group bacterium GW2011_GWC1_43_11b]|uniref:Thioredoxin domain-containing protein n=2 Tax=Candidatus Vogeliibacteriota TaxID=1817922 RepID=A0A1G2QD96_9BACT|nr:MAG: Periplasmic thiol:disulfide interchange protein DsbA [Parcubacteria group bacterium GW2011_GWB1_42_9]KKS89624.1 MAG: hypothetical protein UV64_C0003G0022 [Parcubacteria group bacterium GW2011_GWC1_43_11b]KKT10075.1 MAG: Periplasmic thiol:disulfide interchange protein DsbA [Parcubacteria group bacterium GW2011_GWA1_43_21]OHA58059.1 MAG: hypothetical protein A2370_01715 [Candidatus Vogelbacteria bacterium RIFOXYB1_FULL_42_16]OHA58329.1 MAG: hypothetical protein A2607_00390 [Candidatus Vog